MTGTTIKSLAQLAGVECPKEKGEMGKDDSCCECVNFLACIKVVRKEFGVNHHLCPDCNGRMSGYERKEFNRSTAEWRKLYLCRSCGAWWERRTDLGRSKS